MVMIRAAQAAAREEKADALLIAGGVYDRAVPAGGGASWLRPPPLAGGRGKSLMHFMVKWLMYSRDVLYGYD